MRATELFSNFRRRAAPHTSRSPATPAKTGVGRWRSASSALSTFDDVTMLGVVAAILWLAISVAWTRRGSWGQLLWLCDVATLGTAAGLLMRSPLLLTAQFTGMLAFHLGWHIDFFCYAIVGRMPFAATAYMFGGDLNPYEKALSFFQHTFLVPMSIWGLSRTGVSQSGWIFQTVQGLVALALTFLLTAPSENINWIFGAGFADLSPAAKAPAAYYFLLICLPPLLVYRPSNRLADLFIKKARLPQVSWRSRLVAVPALTLVGATLSLFVGLACQPLLQFALPVAEDASLAESIPVGTSAPRIDSISFGSAGHTRTISLIPWHASLPMTGRADGARFLLLRRLVKVNDFGSIPPAPQQVIIEGTRGRYGTVVCALVGAVSFYLQPKCDTQTGLGRFRVYGYLGKDGLTEFVLPNGMIRPLAENQFDFSGPPQSLFVISVVAFDKRSAARTPFYVVRRTGVWMPDDVVWTRKNGSWTATGTIP